MIRPGRSVRVQVLEVAIRIAKERGEVEALNILGAKYREARAEAER